jgi:Xaa-Pro dipeptidase
MSDSQRPASADFPRSEYEDRFRRLRNSLQKAQLDAVLITSEHNHRYLSGHRSRRWDFATCPLASVYPSTGEPFIVCDAFEARNIARSSWITDIRLCESPRTRLDSFMRTIRDSLQERGLARGRIGAELGFMQRLGVPVSDWEALRRSMQDARFCDAGPILWSLREIKSPLELDVMRRALSLTDAARQKVFDALRPGMSEHEVTQEVYAQLAREGSEPGGYVMAKHLDAPAADEARAFEAGDIIYIDAGGVTKGYAADCCRSVALQRVDSRTAEGFRMLWDLQHEVLDAVKAGVLVRSIVALYDRQLKRLANYTSGIQVGSLANFVGHGIGMEVCEPPNLIAEDGEYILKEGSTLMVEPSFRWGNDWYITEEAVMVTSDGYELLSVPAPREIPIIQG